LERIFDVLSDGNAVSGLSMFNTTMEQMLIQGGANDNWVWGCRLGVDAAGDAGGIVNRRGVRITGLGTDGNLIGTDGGTPPGGNISTGAVSDGQERNIISNHFADARCGRRD
jgi:hypothetical protein